MEKFVYDYTTNHSDILILMIIPIVGIAFLSYSIYLIKKKKKGFTNNFFKAAGFIVFIFTAVITLNTLLGYFSFPAYLHKPEDCFNVEGYVENFHAAPFSGHDSDRFEINGVYFEYGGEIGTQGYNKTAAHGGIIRKNGQHLKIYYIENPQEDKNIILYIAEITDDTEQNKIKNRIQPAE